MLRLANLTLLPRPYKLWVLLLLFNALEQSESDWDSLTFSHLSFADRPEEAQPGWPKQPPDHCSGSRLSSIVGMNSDTVG